MAQNGTSLWGSVSDGYFSVMGDPDPRTIHWFMVRSPVPTILFVAGYIYCSKVLGPILMKNKQPYVLRKPMIAYNFLMVILTAILLVRVSKRTIFNKKFKIIGCQPLSKSFDSESVQLLSLLYWGYVFRFVEFIDTLFFVMRKKFNHITVLHLFHHAAIPVFAMLTMIHYPGNSAIIAAMLNWFVHVIMYSYYGLAAFGPGIQKYLWWKKYLTVLQMIQFLLVFLHMAQWVFVPCDLKPFPVFLALFFSGVFFSLFLNFYIQEYNIRQKRLKKAAQEAAKDEAKAKSEVYMKPILENGLRSRNVQGS